MVNTTIKLALTAVVLLVVGLLAGYGIGTQSTKSTQLPVTYTTTLTNTITVTYTTTSTVTIATPTIPPVKGLKVAAIYVTPLEEPWNTVLHTALSWAKEKYGIDYRYVEKVSEADVESVMRSLINAGYKVIFAHSWGYNEVTRKIAREYPDVFFLQGSGPVDVDWPSNVLVYDYYIQDAAFVAGALAGLLTKSNVIGVVAAFPVEDVNILVNAFIAGARYVNPNVKPIVTYIESWFDPVKGREAAAAQIAAGADFIYAERYGVFEACLDAMRSGRTVYAFGNVVDQNELAPDVVLGSVVWDLKSFVEYVVTNYVDGKLEGGKIIMWGMKEEWAKFIWNEKLKIQIPVDILQRVYGIEYMIIKGELEVPVYRDWNPKRWGI